MSSKTVSRKAVQNKSPRQWIGIVVVYLFIPLVLLVCGGDFGWWQAWIYSLLIFAAGIGGHIWAEQRHPVSFVGIRSWHHATVTAILASRTAALGY
jgi:hypothetical protein